MRQPDRAEHVVLRSNGIAKVVRPKEARQRMRMPIYFAQATDGGPIKIGCSVNVPFHYQATGGPLWPITRSVATMQGGVEDEKAIMPIGRTGLKKN